MCYVDQELIFAFLLHVRRVIDGWLGNQRSDHSVVRWQAEVGSINRDKEEFRKSKRLASCYE